MATKTVTVYSDLHVSEDPVQIHSGDTVSWEGDEDFAIHMQTGYNNPHVQQSGAKWVGTSDPFPGKPDKYRVHYTVTRGGAAHDPDVEVLP